MIDGSPPSPAPGVRSAAIDLLSRREHSFQELLDKLAAKFPELDPRQVLLPQLERLRDEGLQSDARCAESYVRYRSSRGVGPLKIRAELHPRRVDAALVDQALHHQDIDWVALCEEVFMRKFRPSSRADARERARWQRFLQQRGFTHGQIRAVLQRRGGSREHSFDEAD